MEQNRSRRHLADVSVLVWYHPPVFALHIHEHRCADTYRVEQANGKHYCPGMSPLSPVKFAYPRKLIVCQSSYIVYIGTDCQITSCSPLMLEVQLFLAKSPVCFRYALGVLDIIEQVTIPDDIIRVALTSAGLMSII